MYENGAEVFNYSGRCYTSHMTKTTPESIEEKIDVMIACLQRMDKRDRIRTWGGFVRSLISLIPIALFVWSTWYFIAHSDEIMQKMTKYAAESAATMTKDNSAEFMQKIQLMFPGENP